VYWYLLTSEFNQFDIDLLKSFEKTPGFSKSSYIHQKYKYPLNYFDFVYRPALLNNSI